MPMTRPSLTSERMVFLLTLHVRFCQKIVEAEGELAVFSDDRAPSFHNIVEAVVIIAPEPNTA